MSGACASPGPRIGSVGYAGRPRDEPEKTTTGQFRLASLGRVPRPIALASDDRFIAYSGATIG